MTKHITADGMGRCPHCMKRTGYVLAVLSSYSLSDSALKGAEYPILNGPHPIMVKEWLPHECEVATNFWRKIIRFFTGS